MDSTEDEISARYAKQCMHCTRNTFLPYEGEWKCFLCVDTTL